ncbi:MerR family transcriptional regulator [Romboutsia lituseburensis]|uniref:MerR family transcriptional regulator n=1 Tax=Romboutsia lituseburensis TaxID=1537 RepID=UPI00215B6466|nr:MerR family transcriptional regulator [Romboutsia lituseburensis]MCR8744240.1 MerR family transcriptional regulator [Romboutsia lituseburensis]
MEWLMTVGQISKLFNITSETLRHYDRIGLLKPIINEDNGYRYYSLKEIEMLDLILDAKYLEIPLSNIKEALKNESIDNYIDLIDLQEKTIDEKIEHLLKIKEQAKQKKEILNEMLNFENNYDFEKLEIKNEDNTIVFIPIEYLINSKIKQKDSSLRSLYLEPWMIMYEAKDKNTLIDDKKYMAIYEYNTSNLIIEEDKKIYKKKYKGNFIKTKFVGTMDEVEEYIKLILSNFYDNKENLNLDISINWIWVVYNEKGTINFVEITIPLD